MTPFARRQSQESILHKQQGLRIPEIKRAYKVSKDTVRKDLCALEENGRLKGVHWGAFLLKKPITKHILHQNTAA